MRPHPRDGIREKWLRVIASAKIGNAVKVLLLYLVASGRVSPRGMVTFNREQVASELDIHPQRLSAQIREARNAGLLDRRGGGWKGHSAEYEVLLPRSSEIAS